MNNAIESYVNNVLSGNNCTLGKIDQSPKSFLLLSSAKRLIKAWERQKNDSSYASDFELCLRDYLLFIKMPVKIPNYSLSQYGKDNLDLVQTGEIIACKNVIPPYINNLFFADCYSGNNEQVTETRFNKLCTNRYIKDLTGFNYFKSEEQKLAVTGSLNSPAGSTTLVSLSTGGGKSLIIQTLAYEQPGLTIVIVPTISLMLDQVKNAISIIKPKNCNEIQCYNHSSSTTKVIESIKKGELKLLFLSPEALIKNAALRNCIDETNNKGNLKNLIIDEAHIIVEWGSSFRIDFQFIDSIQKKLLRNNNNLRTYLLSATFSKRTVQLLKKCFSDCEENWFEIRCDSLRKEQRYCFLKAKSYADKNNKKIELIKKMPHPMIVYVQSPKEAETLRNQLLEEGLININIFTGETSTNSREQLIKQWSNDEFSIMIATCAFGVGVDKKDVRTVLHLYVPDNPNKYYQEAGRGGRDGFPCLSILLYMDDDVDSALTYASKILTPEKLIGRWFSMLNSTKSVKQGNNYVILDTATKPNYSEDPSFLDKMNQQDIEWNGSVILLMKRCGLLEVDSLEYDGKRYLTKVKINNNSLFYNNEMSTDLLTKARDIEWNSTKQEFRLMSDMLKHADNTCVSETFCEVYGLTEECCSGCNAHTGKTLMHYDSFPLKKNIKTIHSIFINEDETIFGSKDSIIVIFDSIDKKTVLSKTPLTSLIVGDGGYSNVSQLICNNKLCNIFDYTEAKELKRNGKYFFGNCVGLLIEDNQKEINEAIQLAEYINKSFHIKTILFCDYDYDVETRNKKISEIVSGPCFRGDMFLEVLSNV